MPFPPIPWSNAEIERTIHLWNVDGLSCSQVAERLTDEFGTARSRSAVAGLVNRNSLKFDRRNDRTGRRLGHVDRPKPVARSRRVKSDTLLSHEVAFAADLWNRGQTTPRIVTAIGDRFGKTITVFVIHKLVAERPKVFQARAKGELQRGKICAPSIAANLERADVYRAPVTKSDARAYDAASRRLPLADLAWSDCRFPVNEAARGETHLFCGHPALGGKVRYCAHHAARVVGSGTIGEQRADRDARYEAKRAA